MRMASCDFNPEPFAVSVSEEELQACRTLVELSPLPKSFFEGNDPSFGITSEWMREAKEKWLARTSLYVFRLPLRS